MRLASLWLHLLGTVVWLGGLMYQAHVLVPGAGRPEGRALVAALARGRATAWTALALVLLTGFYNITQLGPPERVMASGAGLYLAGKFFLVLVAVGLAGHRDFAQVPRLARALAGSQEGASALSAIAWLDRLVLVLGVVIIYLGLAVARSQVGETPPTWSEAGDAKAGVLPLVAAVDGGQHRRDAFQRTGVAERPHVDGPESQRGPEHRHRRLGLGVVAAQQQVAVDGVAAVGQLMGGDVVEGGDDPSVGQQLLDLLGAGAGGGRCEQARAAEGQGHDRAHHDLTAAPFPDLGQGGPEPAGG
jgi:uncharacterized membrane protein